VHTKGAQQGELAEGCCNLCAHQGELAQCGAHAHTLLFMYAYVHTHTRSRSHTRTHAHAHTGRVPDPHPRHPSPPQPPLPWGLPGVDGAQVALRLPSDKVRPYCVSFKVPCAPHAVALGAPHAVALLRVLHVGGAAERAACCLGCCMLSLLQRGRCMPWGCRPGWTPP